MGGFPENPPSDVLLKYRRLLSLVNDKDEARNRPWVFAHGSNLNQAGGAYLAPKMLFLKRNPKFIFGLHILPWMTELHRGFDLRLGLGSPLHTYTATQKVWTLPNGGGGRPHRPWRLTQVFDLCTDPKLRVMIRWHEIKISRPKMECFRWESFIFLNSKKFSSH